jgi:hypothetical protein
MLYSLFHVMYPKCKDMRGSARIFGNSPTTNRCHYRLDLTARTDAASRRSGAPGSVRLKLQMVSERFQVTRYWNYLRTNCRTI